MTVKELIEKLKEFPEDMEVMTGCGCSGHTLKEMVIQSHFKRVYKKEEYKGEMQNLGDKVWLK